MKPPDKLTRRYLVAAVVLAVATWEIAFNFGAHKVIFFETFFLVWVVSLAILIADFALDKKRLLKGWSLVAMLAPSAVFALTVWSYHIGDTSSNFNFVLFVISTLVTILFLPYAAYIIVSVTHSDMLTIKSKRLAWWLVGLVCIIATLGFLIGHYNRYFLSCESFTVSGNHAPDNCHAEERTLNDRF